MAVDTVTSVHPTYKFWGMSSSCAYAGSCIRVQATEAGDCQEEFSTGRCRYY